MTLWMWMLLACDKDEEATEDLTLTNFEQIIDITAGTAGSFSCFAPGSDWLSDTADSACLGDPVAVDGFVEVASKLCRHYNGPHDIAQGSFTLAVQKSHENVREMALVSTAPG